jgi:hypothetical protein
LGLNPNNRMGPINVPTSRLLHRFFEVLSILVLMWTLMVLSSVKRYANSLRVCIYKLSLTSNFYAMHFLVYRKIVLQARLGGWMCDECAIKIVEPMSDECGSGWWGQIWVVYYNVIWVKLVKIPYWLFRSYMATWVHKE